VTLKIERITVPGRTRIRLSGEFRSEHVDQVKAELERGGSGVDLDLDEVNLVDVECIRFLNACEMAGIAALNCSPYIREWMSSERGRPEASTQKRKKGRSPSEEEQENSK